MYAPRQYRPEKKKPYANFLALEETGHSGPIMAPPAYSELPTSQGAEEAEVQEGEEKLPSTAEIATEQNAVQRNKAASERDETASESAAKGKTVQRKQLGRAEKPPQLKLKAGSVGQFKLTNSPLQFKADGPSGAASSGKSGGGNGIPEDVKGQMESSFGTSFDDVKITPNSNMAKSAGALAFAQGNNVHFAPGQYNPSSKGGQELLGHELAHVVQQREGRVKPTAEVGGMPMNNDKGLEAEADALGAKAAQLKAAPAAKRNHAASTGSDEGAVQMKMDPNVTDFGTVQRKKENDKQEEGRDERVDSFGLLDDRLALDGFNRRPEEEGGDDAPVEIEEHEKPKDNTNPIAEGSQLDEAESDDEAENKEAENEGPEKQSSENPETAEPMSLDAPIKNAASNKNAPAGNGVGETTKKLETDLEKKIPAQKIEQETSEPEPEIDPSGFSLLEAIEQNSEEIAESKEAEGPAIQRASDPTQKEVNVAELQARITNQATKSLAFLQQHSLGIKAQASEKANGLDQQIDEKIDAGIALLEINFAARKESIKTKINASRVGLQLKYIEADFLLNSKGSESKKRIDHMFDDFGANMDATIEGYASEMEQNGNESKSNFRAELQAQAVTARQMGEAKAAQFGNDERGKCQKDEVLAVAEKVASEIEAKIDSNVAALADIVDPAPEQLRDEGKEFKEDVNDQREQYYDQVDQQVHSTRDALVGQKDQVEAELNNLEGAAIRQLEAAQSTSTEIMEQRRFAGHAQVKRNLESFNSQIDAAYTSTEAEINNVKDDAIVVLEKHQGAGEKLIKFSDEVVSTLIAIQGEVASEMSASLEGLNGQGNTLLEGLGKAVLDQISNVASGLAKLETGIGERLDGVEAAVDGQISTVFEKFDEFTDNLSLELEAGFNEQLGELDGMLNEIVIDVAEKVEETKGEALAENQSVVDQLPARLDEAAKNAAWKFDHPVLAWGARILGGILGVLWALVKIVGMLIAVIAIVIALIVLAAASTIWAIVAAIIAVALVVLLLYSIYDSFMTHLKSNSWWMAALWTLSDLVGFSDVIKGFSEPGLSAFDQGFLVGDGGTNVVLSLWGLGKTIGKTVANGFRRMVSRIKLPKLKNLFGRGSSSAKSGGLKLKTPGRNKPNVTGTAKMGTDNLKPLGLGSTGRTTASNLIEKLAMEEAISNPAAGQIIQKMKPLTDPRWLGWRKMQYEHIGLDGSKTIIHYNGHWIDGVLKAVDDFKFK